MKDGQQIVKCFAGDDPAVEESDDVAGDTGGDERSFAYALDALLRRKERTAARVTKVTSKQTLNFPNSRL